MNGKISKILTFLAWVAIVLLLIAYTVYGFMASAAYVYRTEGYEYTINAQQDTCVIVGLYEQKVGEVRVPAVIGRYNVIGVGTGAFANQPYMTTCDLPDSVKTIGDGAFENCPALIRASVGNGITEIPAKCFKGCTALEEVTVQRNFVAEEDDPFAPTSGIQFFTRAVPNAGMQGIHSIGAEAFLGCLHMAQIEIPATVEYIGQDAFKGCDSMSAVTYHSSTAEWNKIYISSGNNAIVYTPKQFDVYTGGDANGDGDATSIDAVQILQYDAGLVYAPQTCDVNADKFVDNLDAYIVLAIEAGLMAGL